MQILSAYIEAAQSGKAQTITAFANGQLSPYIFKVSDLSQYKSSMATTPRGDEPAVSTLSGYYNSDWVLWTGRYYAEPFEVIDELIEKDGTKGEQTSSTGMPVGYTNSTMYIPMKRLNGYSRLTYTARVIVNNGNNPDGNNYNSFLAGAAAVVNGEMQIVIGEVSTNEDWTTLSVDISALPYIDYIVLKGCDGTIGFKSLVLEV